MEAHCNNNLHALVISGTPTPDELKEAWELIVFEYSTIIRNDHTGSLYSLEKQIGEARAIILYVDNALKTLRLRYSIGLPPNHDTIEGLMEMGYIVEYDENNPEAYMRSLNAVGSILKTLIYDLELLEDEHSRLKKSSEGQKQSEDDFMKNVVMLKKWDYKIDLYETFMDEYAQAMNLYIREVAEVNKKR